MRSANSESPLRMQPITASAERFGSSFGSSFAVNEEPETTDHESSFASDTYLVETSDDDERSLRAGSTEGEVFNVQGPIHHAIAPILDRYIKQKKSAHGKLAYVVFAGNDVGVFYNWTAAATAISGLENSRKVYKGYTSYQDAHSAWDGFAGTGCLPHDVATTLGSKPYPTPPISSTPSRVSAPPTTPKRRSASPLYLQTPYTPRSGHVSTPLGGPSSSTYGNRFIPVASPSSSSPSTPISTQSRNAAALAVVREEAFRADQEDYWVVFTGTAPGVHQGREAGERAFGQFENPSFVRTSARDHANQIFVNGYMDFLVVRYVN